MAKLSFALLCLSLSAVAFATSPNANAFGPRRRDHADLGRLVKKRTPIEMLGDQPSASSAAQSVPGASTSAVAQTTPESSSSSPTTSEHAPASASASATTNGGLLGSVVSQLLPTESSAMSTPSPTTVSSSHSSGLAQTSAQASQPPAGTPAQSQTQSVLYLTTGSVPTPTQTSSASSSSSSGMSHAAMTVIIVIAASVGAAVIVWTIIRKWKFRPSSDFEGRMQPIDWQPSGGDDDAGLPSQGSLSRASSFHSGSASGHGDDQMRGPMGGYGTSPLNPIPDHDFTAGPVHLASVGGYADLARGQPMMQESLSHTPSINRAGQYDQYGVPLHHGYGGY